MEQVFRLFDFNVYNENNSETKAVMGVKTANQIIKTQTNLLFKCLVLMNKEKLVQ